MEIRTWSELGTALGTSGTHEVMSDIDIYAEYGSEIPPRFALSGAINSIIKGNGHSIYNLPLAKFGAQSSLSSYINVDNNSCYITLQDLIFRNLYPHHTNDAISSIFTVTRSNPGLITIKNCQFYGDVGLGGLSTVTQSYYNCIKFIDCSGSLLCTKDGSMTFKALDTFEAINCYFELQVKQSTANYGYFSDNFKASGSTFVIKDLNNTFSDFGFGKFTNCAIYLHSGHATGLNIYNITSATQKSIFVNCVSNGITDPSSAKLAFSEDPAEVITESWLSANGFTVIT